MQEDRVSYPFPLFYKAAWIHFQKEFLTGVPSQFCKEIQTMEKILQRQEDQDIYQKVFPGSQFYQNNFIWFANQIKHTYLL